MQTEINSTNKIKHVMDGGEAGGEINISDKSKLVSNNNDIFPGFFFASRGPGCPRGCDPKLLVCVSSIDRLLD